MFIRPSLPNIVNEHIKFDHFVLTSAKQMPETYCDVKGKECEKCNPKVKPNPPSMEILQQFMKHLRSILNMDLFGLDMIYNRENNCYYIFDINPFPSFTKYDNFIQSYCNYLKEKINNYNK